jgi:hypothetical protein
MIRLSREFTQEAGNQAGHRSIAPRRGDMRLISRFFRAVYKIEAESKGGVSMSFQSKFDAARDRAKGWMSRTSNTLKGKREEMRGEKRKKEKEGGL